MKFYSILFSCFLAYSGYAQTYVSGGIFSDETWTASNSPYVVIDDIVVFEDVTLTVEPGVSVQFYTGTEMEVRGTLYAVGTVTDSIYFTSNEVTKTMGDWFGIDVIGNTEPLHEGDQITMAYVNGMYAKTFIDMDIAYHGPYLFDHCYFAYNQKVNEDGGSPLTSFDNCTFEKNNTAVDWCQFDSKVSNSFFYDNIDGLIGIDEVVNCYFSGHTNIAMQPYGETSGCTVENNYIGVSCPFNAVNKSFVGNVVKDNTRGIDMLSYFNGTNTFISNTICNNTDYNLKLYTANNADLAGNCWCSTDSATIRAGIVDAYVDISLGIVDFMPFDVDCPVVYVGMTSTDLANDIQLYPNPSQGEFLLSQEIGTYQIFNQQGRMILEGDSKKIDLSLYPSGIYILKAEGVNRKLVRL